MSWNGVIWYGGTTPVFKVLLRTGSQTVGPNPFQWFVGGDRPVPFGPLPQPSSQPYCNPTGIAATGPGLNDWVVVYTNRFTQLAAQVGGTAIAFSNHLGLFTEIDLNLQNENPFGGAVVPQSSNSYGTMTGFDFSGDFDANSNTISRTILWAKSNGTVGGITRLEPPTLIRHRFPGLLLDQTPQVTANPALTHAVVLENTAQTLYFENLSSVALSPTIPSLVPYTGQIILTNNLILHHISTSETDLLILAASEGGTINVTARRWRLSTDGTWTALSDASIPFDGGDGGYVVQFFLSGSVLGRAIGLSY